MRRNSEIARASFLIVTIFLPLAVGAGCGRSNSHKADGTQEPGGLKAADVNDARLRNADREPGNWMSYGRTYNEQRFSPLKEVNDRNVGQLGLAWHYDLDTRRGQEATPVVIDGVMYFTSAWSKVFALNAATGALLWTYDPKVPPEWGVNACCESGIDGHASRYHRSGPPNKTSL